MWRGHRRAIRTEHSRRTHSGSLQADLSTISSTQRHTWELGFEGTGPGGQSHGARPCERPHDPLSHRAVMPPAVRAVPASAPGEGEGGRAAAGEPAVVKVMHGPVNPARVPERPCEGLRLRALVDSE